MVLMSLRTIKHDTTGYSPFEIIYGRKPNTISCENLIKPESTHKDEIHEFVFKLSTRITEIKNKCSNNIESMQSKYKRQYDKNICVRDFIPGEVARIKTSIIVI